ncbi:hypothetical protein J2S18_002037 [Eubacterium multiforme]|uniref:Uncharacterized protein n=1 Tax=Eubacterium multiforme TaxID=83339 RepID=A0ABT9UUZ2_9FIRM|nr:hypothetical protein [Eubacterium multiforme]
MKILYLLNNLLILFAISISAYIYTTYYGFLGFGNVEFEKFLIIPIFTVPIFIITFIINLIIKIKKNLSKNELFFPIYSLLAMFLPLFLGDCISYFLKLKILPLFMFIGNILGLLLLLIFFYNTFIKIKNYL